MTTKEMIRFLIETEYINYSEDYKVIDEIVARLKHYETLKKAEKKVADKVYVDYLLEKRQGRV